MDIPEAVQPEPEAPKTGICHELRSLGQNLTEAARVAWETREQRRERIRRDIQTGLSDLRSAVSKASNEFKESPTGQRMRKEMEDCRVRVRRGEVSEKVREQILSMLQTVNSELEKAMTHKSAGETDQTNAAG